MLHKQNLFFIITINIKYINNLKIYNLSENINSSTDYHLALGNW